MNLEFVFLLSIISVLRTFLCTIIAAWKDGRKKWLYFCSHIHLSIYLSIHLLIYVFSWISTLPFSTYHPSIHLSTHLCVQNILSPVLKPGTRLCRETQEVTQTTWFWLLYFSESSGSVSRESKNHFKYDYKTLQELWKSSGYHEGL